MQVAQVTHRIVLAADARYAMPLAVTLSTLSRALSEPRSVPVVVLSDGIVRSDQARIRESCPEIAVEFIELQSQLTRHLPVSAYLSRTTYARLLIPSVVDANIDRVLYLDCDTLVIDDPTPLFATDLGSYAVAAVPDQATPVAGLALLNWRELRLHPHTPYFNGGFLLIDLKAWRASELSDRAFGYTTQHADTLRWADQDALNAILRGQFKPLHLRWNQQRSLRRTEPMAYGFFDIDEVDAALADPAIVHFSEAPKPWERGCRDPAAPSWRAAVQLTRWSSWSLPPAPSLGRRAATRLAAATRRLLAPRG